MENMNAQRVAVRCIVWLGLLRSPIIKMKYPAGLNGKLDEIIWIAASNLMQSGLNIAGDMKRMWPRSAVYENSATTTAVAFVNDEICPAIRGTD
jgi:hypothetical protein